MDSQFRSAPKFDQPPQKRLFIGGLPYRFTEGQLLELFAPFGRIVSLRIMHNQWGKSRGLGFVEFDNLQSAIEAKRRLHNHRVDVDRTIIVDFAQPDPFNTPEGQQRHQDAMARKGPRHNRQSNFHPEMRPNEHPDRDHTQEFSHFQPSTGGQSRPKRKFGERPQIPKNRGNHLRQSVYESRYHGSKVGAKFASRSRFKKSK